MVNCIIYTKIEENAVPAVSRQMAWCCPASTIVTFTSSDIAFT